MNVALDCFWLKTLFEQNTNIQIKTIVPTRARQATLTLGVQKNIFGFEVSACGMRQEQITTKQYAKYLYMMCAECNWPMALAISAQ